MAHATNVAGATATERPDSKFRPDVEALRAVAVLAVLLYHFQLPPCRGGFVGVDIFFVISGFVITRTLLSERARTGSMSLPGFYLRRARRILPAATVTIVGTVVATYVVLGAASGVSVAHDGFAAALFYANVHFAHASASYFNALSPQSPLVHFWSLSIEEQFYFLWPALLLVLGMLWRRGRDVVVAIVLVAIVATALILSAHWTAANPNAAYYASFIRMGELALGALIAVGESRLARLPQWLGEMLSLIGGAGIVLSIVLLTDQVAFPGWVVIGPTVSCALLIIAGCRDGAVLTKLTDRRLLRHVGATSYSIYLWHWPVYALASQRLGHTPSWPERLALIVPTVALAELSYWIIENPVRRRTFWRAPAWRTVALGAALVASSLGTVGAIEVAGASTSGIAAPNPPATLGQLQVQLSRALTHTQLGALVVPLTSLSSDVPYSGFDRGCLVAFDAPSALGARPRDCRFGDVTSPRTLVLYGDSNADMWLATFDAIGRLDHFGVELIARASCQVNDSKLWDPALHQPGVQCTAFRAWAMREIARIHPAVTVVTDYGYGLQEDYHQRLVSPAEVGAGVQRTLTTLGASSRIVLYLGTPPPLSVEPGPCLAVHSTDVRACDVVTACLTETNQLRSECAFDPSTGRTWQLIDPVRRAATAAKALYVNTSAFFCVDTGCPSVVRGIVVNFDLRHISMHYSLYIAPAMADVLARGGVLTLISP